MDVHFSCPEDGVLCWAPSELLELDCRKCWSQDLTTERVTGTGPRSLPFTDASMLGSLPGLGFSGSCQVTSILLRTVEAWTPVRVTSPTSEICFLALSFPCIPGLDSPSSRRPSPPLPTITELRSLLWV